MKYLLLPLLATLALPASSLEAEELFKSNTLICSASQKPSLFNCIKDYKSLGVSPDAALKECKRDEFKSCVEKLTTQNFVAKSVEEVEEGFLIDLGNVESRWMQGGEWEAKGCVAYKEGISRTEDARNWKWEAKRQYFRQGWCEASSIELNQVFSDEEAKNSCDLKNLDS